jgi:hypothetical protein
MSFPRPAVDIRAPPEDLDALIDWFELVSSNLVLLEEYPIADVESACARVGQALRLHSSQGLPSPAVSEDAGLDELRRVLEADHRWFERSLDQLDWSLDIVRREDHGGHRQALGQYGRILAESLRRHRADEARYGTPLARRRPTVTRSSKAK